MSNWSRAWLVWVAAFAVIEGAALHKLSRTGDGTGTLSWHIAETFWVKHPAGRTVWAVTVMVAAICLWIHIHLIGKGHTVKARPHARWAVGWEKR